LPHFLQSINHSLQLSEPTSAAAIVINGVSFLV
jgi:hypothetical protein